MENYFIFNGMDSRDYNIKCSSPPIIMAKKAFKKIAVPGRSGHLLIDENYYEPVYKTIRCRMLAKPETDSLFPKLREKGRLILSSEPEKYYMAYVSNDIAMEYILADYRAFDITFCCEPFKYSLEEENDFISVKSSPLALYGKGNISALPFIKIYGSGTISLTINGSTIQIKNVSGNVTIDSRFMSIMTGNTNMSMHMTGEFPMLLGNGELNTISFSGNISKIEIQPNWRWL